MKETQEEMNSQWLLLRQAEKENSDIDGD